MARFVFASKQGRLANRLAVSCHLIGAACEAGIEFFNPAMDEYADLFEGTAPGIMPRYPVAEQEIPSPDQRHQAYMRTNVKTRILGLPGKFSLGKTKVIDLSLRQDRREQVVDPVDIFRQHKEFNGTVYLRGWLWRSYENVEKHAPEIREYFSIRSPHAEKVAANVDAARQLGSTVVGVHIRQGDYRTWQNGKFFHESAVYARMMREMAEQLGPSVAFLVASNEPQEPALFEGLKVHISQGNAVQDLYSLAGCDYLLGPPSTYSNYASFYGDTPLYFIQGDDDKIDIANFAVKTRV